MTLKKTRLLVVGVLGMSVLLLVSGCFRQSPDNFEPIDSEGASDVQPNQLGDTDSDSQAAPTNTVVLIDPSAGEEDTATPDRAEPTTLPNEPTATVLPPTNTRAAASEEPTVRIIQPTSTPQGLEVPDDSANDGTVPTATREFVTPGADTVRDFPSPSPSPTALDGSTDTAGGLVTPTALPGTEGGACQYVVQSGDNLFRIAINNDVALDDLLAANSLSEGSVIQPGQTLVLPNCEETGDASDTTVESTPAAEATQFTGEGTRHVVQSGETLAIIAQQYGVTITAIVEANDLPDPDRLDVGQELVIPVSDS